MSGDVDTALLAFRNAAVAAERDGHVLAEQLRSVEQLTRRIQELRRRREAHRAEQAVLELAERRTLLELLERVPPCGAEWSQYSAGGLDLAEEADPSSTRNDGSGSAPRLAVALLGPTEVHVDEVDVRDWNGGRARSLLAYLVTHRKPWPASQVLMAVFWPESRPAAARNSLHVAVHGLRRAFRAATNAEVIVRDGDSYRLDAGVRLQLDVDDFDSLVGRGRASHQAARVDEAIAAYEAADLLYRGDFLVESPYEDWSALLRERLRLAHLDALLRLSALQFDAGRYPECTQLCQRVLTLDPCNEDIRRCLMRCYARQGRPHLALFEFRQCVEVLASQLGIAPAPTTVALRDRISEHSFV